MPTKFISFDRLSRYTQKLKSYVGAQIQAAKTEWQNQLKLKVDKVTGKGLSTNDFTNEYKSKLDGIESGAQKNTVTGIKGDSESAYRTGNVNLTPANIGALEPSGDASNTKVSFTQSSGRANLTSGETLKTSFGKLSKWYADLKAVAFSGSYNDLSNKPTAFKNPQSLTIQQNGGSQTEYDGSTKLTVNITKAGIGLGNVENKSSATIRGELTSSNVTTALGFTPAKATDSPDLPDSRVLWAKCTTSENKISLEVDEGSLPNELWMFFIADNNPYASDPSLGITYNNGSAQNPADFVEEDGTPVGQNSYEAGDIILCKYTQSDAKLTIKRVYQAPYANEDVAGFMSAADKTKLDGIATGANKCFSIVKPVTLSADGWTEQSVDNLYGLHAKYIYSYRDSNGSDLMGVSYTAYFMNYIDSTFMTPEYAAECDKVIALTVLDRPPYSTFNCIFYAEEKPTTDVMFMVHIFGRYLTF